MLYKYSDRINASPFFQLAFISKIAKYIVIVELIV